MYTVILQIITKITLQIGIMKISVDTLKWNTKNGKNSNNLIESKKGQRRREGNGRNRKQLKMVDLTQSTSTIALNVNV